jgi:hypothetical protein
MNTVPLLEAGLSDPILDSTPELRVLATLRAREGDR